MALKDKIKEFVGDISKLEVTTLTGNLETSVIVDANDSGKINFQNIMDNLSPADGAPSTVKIVASSKIDFDKDVVQYVQENADPVLVELHHEAVKSSQEARAAFVNAIIDMI